MTYIIAVCTVKKLPMMDVEFYSKNKFEKLVRLVGFNLRIK